MELTFLGTSGSAPTKDRGLTSVALHVEGNTLLFDCPEGCQRQMMQFGVSFMKVSHILISHFHSDHFLGIPGLLATMTLNGRTTPLAFIGPPGLQSKVNYLLKTAGLKPSFELSFTELEKGTALKNPQYTLKAFPLNHEITCLGYCFQETDKAGEFMRAQAEKLGIPPGPLYAKLAAGQKIKLNGKTFSPNQVMDYSKGRKGRKISVIFDTAPSKKYWKEIRESDILIHESTFLSAQAERAQETLHCTARDAATAARESRCKKLFLIHLSPRIQDSNESLQEARSEFPSAQLAQEGQHVNVDRN
ncbi:MAG: ribonuclease Z [Candidatus Diapherotrites archaeon]|nr:ribonuclease Z [Candidatus Diapherotrites archaeon]